MQRNKLKIPDNLLMFGVNAPSRSGTLPKRYETTGQAGKTFLSSKALRKIEKCDLKD